VASALFSRLNLFVSPGFFDSDLCARLRAEMQSCRREKALVQAGASAELQEQSRRTKTVEPPAETHMLVQERLEAVMPELATSFGVELQACEGPRFLIYEEGDFFHPHRDTHDTEVPEQMAARKVSATLPLNDQAAAPTPDTYGGGALVFAGLVPGLGDPGHGFSVPLQAGTLLAFRSSTLHEVKPVTRGERYSVVTWFS
jgi:SM-20-related protein